MANARRGAPVAAALTLTLVFAAAAQAGVVVDIAAPAGISQTAESWDVAIGDYNVDGYDDFLYSPQNGGPRQLWRNNADGKFTLVTTLAGSFITDQHGCAWADVDHNRLPDAYCVLGATGGSREKANSLWMQTAPGVFVDEGVIRDVHDPLGRGRNATFLDANKDGYLDLFVSNYAAERDNGTIAPNRFYLNLGADPLTGAWLGYRSAPEYGLDKAEGDRGCTYTVDFNRDGRDDLVFCGATTVRMYRNDGNQFTDVHKTLLGADLGAADTAITDLNRDGIADFVYVRLGQFAYRPGVPNGTYGPAVQARILTAGRSIVVTDVDGDGDRDVYILQSSGKPGCVPCSPDKPDLLLLNNGTGFLTATSMPQYTVGAGDKAYAIDVLHDGSSEILQTNGANYKKAAVRLLRFAP
jgi:hypothetical protein